MESRANREDEAFERARKLDADTIIRQNSIIDRQVSEIDKLKKDHREEVAELEKEKRELEESLAECNRGLANAQDS